MSQMGKFISAASIGALETLTGNVGGAVNGDAVANIDIIGTDPITVTGNPAAWTLTITVADATTTQKGVVELATDAESIAGADTSRPIVPSSLVAKLGAMTANTVPYGAGTAAALSWMAAGTDGQVIIGATGAAPAFASLTSSGGFITFTPGANTLDLNTAGAVAISFDGDAGTATPALGVLTIAGGNNIGTTGAGSTMTIDLTGTTQYAVQVGDATGSLDSLPIGSANQVLQSSGAGANPAWSTATYPATTTQGDILYSSADNTIASLAKDATATRYLANTGASNNPAWDQVNLTNGVTGTLPVTNGGTGLATITDHGVMVGSGTAAVTPLAVGTDGQVLIGATGADPAFASIASAGSTITFTPGANTLNMETGGTVAISFPTDAGTATPAVGALTIAGGTNINTSGAASTATINLDAAIDGMTAVDFAAGGRIGTATGAGNTLLIQAYDVDGAAYTTFATLTANNTPTMDLDTDVTINSAYIYRAGGTDIPVTDGGTGASTLTDHGVLVGSGTGAVSVTAVGATGEVLKGNTGADPTWGAVDLTSDVTGTLPVSNGGSGATTFTDHGVLLGSGAAAFSVTAEGASNTVLHGNTGGDPTFSAVDLTADVTGTLPVTNGGTGAASLTDGGILLGSGTGAVTALGQATNGQLPIGSTGSDPVLATLTEGANITITNGAGSITIASSGGGGITWNEVTGTSQSASVENGYIANNASLVTITLPATASVGETVRVVGLGAGGVKIAQNASQYIRWDESNVSTTGATGYLQSTDDHDAVELLCTVTNNGWSVLSSKGNWTIA